MCCGFLKLDIDEFMDIQKRLLLQQIELLRDSPLGQKVLRGARPETIENSAAGPADPYKDYCPDLLEKREDGLR
jgi:hypothetical protein